MKYETIADIYAANESIRRRLESNLVDLSPDEATVFPDDEKWSVQMIVEHLSIVDSGTARICAKLLAAARADGKQGDGRISLSADFGEKSKTVAEMKVEAPERVRPTGDAKIADSLEKMAASRRTLAAMRSDMERLDLLGHKFPHPFFGDITAPEWLIVLGGHELRHTKQIERLIERIRQ